MANFAIGVDLGGTNLRIAAVDEIAANQYQPRRDFDDQALEELAQSIRANFDQRAQCRMRPDNRPRVRKHNLRPVSVEGC